MPIRYIINTSADLHNVSGNAELAAVGMFGSTPSLAPGELPGATLVAHENVMIRLTALGRERRNPFPSAAIPRSVYFLPQKDIWFNDEPVFIIHEPNAQTNGDSIVLFRKSDTISVGDLFVPGRYPVIDVEQGGDVQGLILALNHILDLAVPERLQADSWDADRISMLMQYQCHSRDCRSGDGPLDRLLSGSGAGLIRGAGFGIRGR